jgi:sugar/nucleoside kinase (ribokinase family)
VSVSEPTLDVVALGHPLVDVLTHETDDVVARANVERGAMTMVDASRSDEIYAQLGPAQETSGGSAANTAAGVASFGGRAAFIGRIADDTFGRVFAHDLRSIGVEFDVTPATDGAPTGRCLVIVGTDAERTMCTYLGAGAEFGARDVDAAADHIASAAVTYLEGYLWDEARAKDGIRRAASLARDAGRQVALTLSDPFCVERHRDEFRALVETDVDVLFANEHEITMLYQVDDFDEAARRVADMVEIAALTCGPKGSLIVGDGARHEITAEPVTQLVDTTGAGDLYAAGFLFGLTHGRDLATCGRLASIAAAEVISHLGARPEASLAGLAASTD